MEEVKGLEVSLPMLVVGDSVWVVDYYHASWPHERCATLTEVKSVSKKTFIGAGEFANESRYSAKARMFTTRSAARAYARDAVISKLLKHIDEEKTRLGLLTERLARTQALIDSGAE